jgi:indolepyruvate ferredoxin oxidoreductase beta subunit
MISQQLIISGVGGQGILFITRLLAETAIAKGMPVLTSETHGMAQRGGIVISHLKAGAFSSPLVRPGHADGLIVLKPGNVRIHRSFLRPDGWIAANAGGPLSPGENEEAATIDADTIAMQLGNPQAVNLIVLGRALATGRLFCAPDELDRAIRQRLQNKPALLEEALAALAVGTGAGR